MKQGKFRGFALAAIAIAVLFTLPGTALADRTTVAVAANFTEAAKEIAEAFAAETGHEAILSFGSTGQLYTQITQDAPFDVLLAADAERPAKALAEGYGVENTDFTYAIGKVVLWSADGTLVTGEETLKSGSFEKIAIANPQTAPYGAAAVEVMKALGVYDTLGPKLVQGNNIGQTYQFVATGNAAIGFVALSQVVGTEGGSRWDVPQALYTPIMQDAVLLRKGEANAAALAFLDFLKGPTARSIIEGYGYAVESDN